MMSLAGPRKRPFGRSLGDFGNLSEAEEKLIACAWRGELCVLGESVPETATADNLIRPELIRFLALGGDDTAPVHEKGVQLYGAYIGNSSLDFEGAYLTTSLWLFNCFFACELTFRNAHAINLCLDYSNFPGFSGDGLELDGNLYLRRVHSRGTVRMLGAVIGGDLDCCGARFAVSPLENKFGSALACDGAKIGGSIFLTKYIDQANTFSRVSLFQATGEVRLRGVKIDNDLNCVDSSFDNQSGAALNCEGANIGGGLFFRGKVTAKGTISFAHATISTLADDGDSWPDGTISLDGFRYKRIDANSPLDAKSRIAWLQKQDQNFLTGDNFTLQPWIHLAKVLREQGHFREAAEVDIAREERLRAAGKVGERWALLSWPRKNVVNSTSKEITFRLFLPLTSKLNISCTRYMAGSRATVIDHYASFILPRPSGLDLHGHIPARQLVVREELGKH